MSIFAKVQSEPGLRRNDVDNGYPSIIGSRLFQSQSNNMCVLAMDGYITVPDRCPIPVDDSRRMSNLSCERIMC